MIGRYEIGFIVAAESSEDEQKKIVDNLTGIIKKGDGKIEQVDEWGLRKLSFPIQKNTDGFYVFIQCEAEGSLVTAVERRLRQIEKVLRFITLRLDDKLKKSNKLTKKWRKQDQVSKKFRESKEEEPAGEEPTEKEEAAYAS